MDGFILQDWILLFVTSAIVVTLIISLRWLLLARHQDLNADQKLPRQLIMLVLSIIAVVIIVLALPVSESSRNQLLGLLGVLVSGVIAFSSTTIVSNLMAGVVLRVNRPFRTGDFIRCLHFSGRVTEKGILDTEIQTQQRTLVHVANSLLINNPVEVIRSSGTLIEAQVSIGYDVHHSVIEEHMLKAANNAGLSDVFVHIVELGDFSITYKVSGLLEDTKSMLTTKSRLFARVLDELHNNDIEIMSPNMIAPRQVDPSYTFIAKAKRKQKVESVTQEDIAFDKAEQAEQLELQKQDIQLQITELKLALSNKNDNKDDKTTAKVKTLLSDEEKLVLKAKIETLEAQLKSLNGDIDKTSSNE